MNIDTSNHGFTESQCAAEDAARARRLDKDRIVKLAIDSLIRDVTARGWTYPNCFIGGASGITMPKDTDSGDSYIGELLSEVYAQLSPLVQDAAATS